MRSSLFLMIYTLSLKTRRGSPNPCHLERSREILNVAAGTDLSTTLEMTKAV